MIALPPKFVAFDLETTGLVNRKDEIIEIGAVKFTVEVKNGRVVPKLISEFDTLVKPNMLIPAEATNVNHITDKMVENAPPVGEALKQFTAFCGPGSILLAHNANFDAMFMKRGEISMTIDEEKMHRSVYDCEMLMEVFVALLRRRLKEKEWEMGSIMQAMAKYKGIPQFIRK